MNYSLHEDLFDRIALFFIHTVHPLLYCLVALSCLKILLFTVNKRQSWKLQDLVYFNQSHLLFSTSDKSCMQKKVQNLLSKSIVLLLFILIILKLMLAEINW